MKWKLAAVKGVVLGAVGISVSYMVSAAVKKLEDENTSTMHKALLAIGGLALSWYATDKIGEFADSKFDEIADMAEEAEYVITELNKEKEA